MAYNDKKIVSILLEQCNSIKQRFPGYKEEMTNLVAEVLNLERDHVISKTNITKKIGDQVNTVGKVLYGKLKSTKSR